MNDKTTPRRQTQALVRVSLHEPGGLPFRGEARLELAGGERSVELERRPGTALFEAEVPPGTYRLTTDAGDWVAPPRDLVVAQGATVRQASVHLGKPSWPAYRYGENIVPFEPHDDLLAVCFETQAPDPQRGARQIEEIAKRFDLEPYGHDDERTPHPAMAADGAIWLFRLPSDDESTRRAIVDELRRELGASARIGLPVDLKPRQVKVMDARFVVRFRDHVTPKTIERLAEAAGARILRGFVQAGNARLIEFQSGSWRDHLETIERWRAEELLVYGEPDLLAEIEDDVFPADPPDDPTYPNQANLTLQNVDDAWIFLDGVNSALTLGSPDVYVATLDRGVDIDHPDIGGNLTDGTPQLAQCWDFSGMRACTVPGYAPDTSHGMGVYGIISALTDNADDMSGIAPNCHHIGMERPSLSSVNYPDVLLWAAGFTTGNPTVGWPAEPISPAADVISCSHGSSGLALSGIMDDTLTYLSVYGRGGRGTLIVYSAGNSGTTIAGFRVWAAHPRTMAISNSMQPDGQNVQRLDGTSNFGPEIDICAQGTGAPSLNASGGEQTFGGTSAAAPTVAAAASLMLSVNPDLTWVDLRDRLRQTAVVIDPLNADPLGQWVGGFSGWYGFGRLDVDAAVQSAEGFDAGTVNRVIRDNLADTGATVPSTGVFWRSPDLWVRQTDPATDMIGDPAYAVDPPNQPALAGSDNWVRARVKNIGSEASGDFFVRVYLTHFAGTQFRYQQDYIPSINSGDPIPNPLVQGTYLIGEQLVNGLASGAELILDFLWPAALVPPETVNGTAWHPCLLAEVSPHTGPAPSGVLVYDNCNLAQRNLTIDYSDDDDLASEATGVIGHAESSREARRIEIPRAGLPRGARVWVRFLDRTVEKEVARRLERAKDREVEYTTVKTSRGGGRAFVAKVGRGGEGPALVLEVPLPAGGLTPVVIGAELPEGVDKGAYEVAVVEQTEKGEALGAFALEIVRRG